MKMRKCPLCGSGSHRLETDWDHKKDGVHVVYAVCNSCHARTKSMPNMEEATAEWNVGKVTSNGVYQQDLFTMR